MKKRVFLYCFTCIFTFIGCTSTKGTDVGSSLPIIDVNKEYPVKRIDIHELAEVTYIPLETTDSSLLQITSQLSISDSNIVVFDILQREFFFFNNQGKFHHKVNRIGQGAEEYYTPGRFDADFENKVFYVWEPSRILAYNFDGTYIKTIKLPKNISFPENIINYDSNYLITFNDSYWPSLDKFNKEAEKEPFYLINKQDGTIKNFNKRLKIEKPVHHIFQMVKGQSGRHSLREGFRCLAHILKNGNDCLLVNNALDTLYSYKNHRLEPTFLRTPSASTMDIPKLITPFAYTDSYFMFGIVPMDYEIGKKYYFDERMAPHYILDRKTYEIFQVVLYDSLLDPEFNVKDERNAWNIFPHQIFISNHSKNQAVGHYYTEFILKKLKEGKLSGKLKDIASKLKEDDNECIAIYKFK